MSFAAFALIGAGISAIGQISSANAAADQYKSDAKMAMYNSQIADENAQRELDAAALEESMQRDRLRRTIGTANTQRAKSGITQTGSSLFVQDDSIIQGELDALMIRNKGDLAANNYRSQSAIYKVQASQLRQAAKNTKKAGRIGALTSLIGGAASYGMAGGKFPGAGLSSSSGTSIPIDFSGYRSPL
ncbi:MAG TPA: hypothetical protein VD999_07900 [Vitreimonas sp.]|nr:hypothetical protein [Vitreimonas sp.]